MNIYNSQKLALFHPHFHIPNLHKNVRNRPTSVAIADIFIKQKAFLIPSGAGIS